MEQFEIQTLPGTATVLGEATTEESLKDRPFITANTIEGNFGEIKNRHIIPVFTKDNEPLISHTDFIESTTQLVGDIFNGEQVLKPVIRLSHPVKGRIPEAKEKPANLLMESEKTIYYERMMFVVEVPSIRDTVEGNSISLTIGGVKAYNQDNLYSRSLCDQHFKVFIGFKNTVCTNLCVWTDGLLDDLKVKSLPQLKASIRTLLESYQPNYHLHHLKQLGQYSITENQFAHLVGRCRMYSHLPVHLKESLPQILFGDQQMGTVVKDFYRDESFCRDENGSIYLWKLYNLFTGANKSSYIDSFLERGINAFNLVEQIRHSLEHKTDCWYLN